jgi:hypothetical protein
MTRSQEDYELVMTLIAEEKSDLAISRLTKIPRATVRDWRRGGRKDTLRFPLSNPGRVCEGGHDYSTLPPEPYCYLLGVYLGDGCISKSRRGVFRLRIVMDTQYPGIIEECVRAIEAVMAGQNAYVQDKRSRCVEISMFSKHWPCMFPQHGPGRKHNRLIILDPWQEQMVDKANESFIRGLIHSDGCRVVANDRGVMSVRYHFSNKSEDIKRLYCGALDALDIPWTRPSDRDIAVYRKAATARLDEFIGPKY